IGNSVQLWLCHSLVRSYRCSSTSSFLFPVYRQLSLSLRRRNGTAMQIQSSCSADSTIEYMLNIVMYFSLSLQMLIKISSLASLSVRRGIEGEALRVQR